MKPSRPKHSTKADSIASPANLLAPSSEIGKDPRITLGARARRRAVHGSARREDELRYTGETGRLEGIVRGDRALFEIEAGSLEPPPGLRVCGQMKDDVVPTHRLGERRQIERIAPDQFGAP